MEKQQENNPKGGVRMDTKEYYDQIAKDYDNISYSGKGGITTGNEFRFRIVKDILYGLPKGKILDAGCGTGKMLVYLKENGYEASGCDFSEGMIAETRKKVGHSARLETTSLDDLSAFRDGEFDIILALGVFPYITQRSTQEASYREIWRTLRAGGTLITTHENELFDLFTLNKYTLRFFKENFGIAEKLAGSLLTNPEKPINKDKQKSGRDFIETIPENPLTYPQRLHGFENKDILYYSYHILPPLLMDDGARQLSSQIEASEGFDRHSLQAMFKCSAFISIAMKVV